MHNCISHSKPLCEVNISVLQMRKLNIQNLIYSLKVIQPIFIRNKFANKIHGTQCIHSVLKLKKNFLGCIVQYVGS